MNTKTKVRGRVCRLAEEVLTEPGFWTMVFILVLVALI